MKSVQIIFLKICNRIIAGLLTILGFTSSCVTNSVEYDVPHADFKVKGQVLSVETDEPIKNIRVIMQGDTAVTDSEGNYQVSDKGAFPTEQIYSIQFHDSDNELNGSYKDLDTIVEFIDPKFEGGNDGWYDGETTKEFDVKMTPEK